MNEARVVALARDAQRDAAACSDAETVERNLLLAIAAMARALLLVRRERLEGPRA